MQNNRPVILATRGSALALAQTTMVLAELKAALPHLVFETKIMKTTGDKLLNASLANPSSSLPKGLFTKELEVALLNGQADLAVHSLKDLPIELPEGLKLGAVSKRADVRDVLIYRDIRHIQSGNAKGVALEWVPGQALRRGLKAKTHIKDLPSGFTVATSSPRRTAQIHAARPDLKVVEIRGNVLTRLTKLAEKAEIDATILACAGLHRLGYSINSEGCLMGQDVPEGLLATILDTTEMLPCVGQAALGIEIRQNDSRMDEIIAVLNHAPTQSAVTAERAFLSAMGGGCHSSSAAHATVEGRYIHMEAMAVIGDKIHRAEARRPISDPAELGQFLAAELSGK